MIKTYADYENLHKNQILQSQIDDWLAKGNKIKSIEQKIGNLTITQTAKKLLSIINRRGEIKSQEMFGIVGVHPLNKVLKKVYEKYGVNIRQNIDGAWVKKHGTKKRNGQS